MSERLLTLKTIYIITTYFLCINTQTDDILRPPACEIFCKGPILDVVQKSNLYPDDKTFVDMKMKFPPSEIFKRFNTMMEKADRKPSKVLVRRFVRSCFSPIENDFVRVEPPGWVPEPKLLKLITDRHLQKWAKDLNALWKRMGRQVRKDVHDNPNLYSIVYLPKTVIVPGGRYREYCYWESYWTILGLLRSDMYMTVKGMLENFLFLVNKYGFVPYGGRIYYLARTNMPLLIPMVKIYVEVTRDKEFLRKNIELLEKEFTFWMTNRTVELYIGGKNRTLCRFFVDVSGPRPEAYRTDIAMSKSFSSVQDRSDFYLQLKSACESGWAFSSRWFINEGTNKGRLKDTKTRYIIPVDLNAVICWNAKILSLFYGALNDTEKSDEYYEIFLDWKENMNEVLWDEEDGVWYDYDMLTNKRRKFYYASNITPLWTKCFDSNKTELIASKVTHYLNENRVVGFEGGIPTSLVTSGNDWDFPKAYPPLQHMIIIGLKESNNSEAEELAFKLAYHWIRSNFRGYIYTNIMYAGYDTKVAGKPGFDMHSEAQKTGYGWTNGVCLDLLYHYGKRLHTRGLNTASQKVLSTTTLSMISILNYLL